MVFPWFERWICVGNDPVAGLVGRMMDVLPCNAWNLQSHVKKNKEICWDLGSNPGPPTHTTRALAICATMLNCQ